MHPFFSQIEAFLFDFDGTLARLNIDFKALRGEILALAASFGLEDPLLPDPPYLLELTLALKEQLSRHAPPRGVAPPDMKTDLVERGTSNSIFVLKGREGVSAEDFLFSGYEAH